MMVKGLVKGLGMRHRLTPQHRVSIRDSMAGVGACTSVGGWTVGGQHWDRRSALGERETQDNSSTKFN